MRLIEWLIKYWLQVFCTGAIGIASFTIRFFCGKLKLYNTEQESLRYGVVSLLRNSLIRNYNDYMRKGYCPIYAMESIETMYQAYKDLGGNGAVTKLYQEIKKLPTKDPKSEEN